MEFPEEDTTSNGLIKKHFFLSCLGLKPESVSLGQMRNAMKEKGSVSPKLTELYTLEKDSTTWLSHAKAMRNHVSHIAGIPLVFYAGGDDDGLTAFKHPKTLVEVPGDYFDNLEKWLLEMESLIVRMRS